VLRSGPEQLLAWLRGQEAAQGLTAQEAARLEHIAASAAHPQHDELMLHWRAFGQDSQEMSKSAKRIAAADLK
jgi:hypothetical protein